jgi:hypothetical protein
MVQPATTGADERYPAVAVTNNNPGTGTIELHVVYQCWNGAGGGQWDICHTWTANWGGAWTAPIVRDRRPNQDAIEPAIVYTEDLSFPGGQFGTLVQIVWSEWNPFVAPARYEIYYDAYYYDPTLVPPGRGYLGWVQIQTVATADCRNPEIASVDETLNALAYDYYFSVVWEERNFVPAQINIWYVDGTTTISPGPMGMVLTGGSLGQLNPINGIGDSYAPDIAATQDYAQQFWYYHVVWVYNIWAGPGGVPPATWQIDTCYAPSGIPNPGALAFIATAPANGPAAQITLNNPTVASKMIAVGVPPSFEIWVCWEDFGSVPASAPDIFFNIGQYTRGIPPGFAWIGVGPAIVPYIQPGGGNTEFNPELWNRNDVLRQFPPLTHLVFDMSQAGAQEVEYIDP